MATVFNRKTLKVRSVKNLGWLLKHWREVKRFTVNDCNTPIAEAMLYADLDTLTYSTPFASKTVLEGFLSRPVFRGLRVNWFGEVKTIR